MRRNLGKIERWIRIGVGLALLLVGLLAPIPLWAEELAAALGILLVVTGGAGYCPLWHGLKFNTCKSNASE